MKIAAYILPLPVWEGVGGRGAYIQRRWMYAPLPPTPSLKGRGRISYHPAPAWFTP